MKDLGLDLLGLNIDDGRDGEDEEITEREGEREKRVRERDFTKIRQSPLFYLRYSATCYAIA